MTSRSEQELAESALRASLARRSSRELLLDPHRADDSPVRLNRSTPIRRLLPFACRALGAGLETELGSFWTSVDFADLPCGSAAEQFAVFLKRRVENGTLRLHFLPELLDFELASSELRFLPRQEFLAQGDTGALTQPLSRDAGLAIHPLMRISRFPCDAEALFATLMGRPREARNARRETFLLLSVLKQPSPEIYQLDPKLGRRLWALQNVGTFGGSDAELRLLGDLRVIVRSH
ncbi:MAG TPA: hypothetical protein VMF52_09075 [Steroidobacteraceae bacterium]|nr:hypothetical protein [Steroidobacteraceae bacterium]